MINRIFKLTIFIVITSLLYSCGGSGGSSHSTGGNENFRSGSDGITLNFMTNNPPSRMYDDEDFKVSLELRNEGAHDISGDARIYISGFDPSIITGVSSSGEILRDFEGKGMYNPEGGFDTVTFSGVIRDLESKNVDYYDSTIMATSCYAYETLASPTVCIDPDPHASTQEKKVCSASTVENLGGSQGAPVAVSSVSVEPAPGKIRFKISVNNVGGGTVMREGAGYLSKCNPYSNNKLDYDDVDYARLLEVKVGDVSITGSCKPLDEGHIRMHSGSGYVWCDLDGLTGSTYKTPMTIKLGYGYRKTIEKEIRIVQTP